MHLDYKWRAALIVALGLFMAVLDVTIVSVALPQMQAYFHTDRDTITWVATAYLLAQAAVIPVTGFVSDRVGTKVVFLTALALFTVGSGLCAISPSEQWLIAFRVFQGIGGGALFPVAFAIIFRIFPPTERGPASALVGVPVLLAPAFGPTIGGFFTQAFDWRAIFLINLPVGVVAFIGSMVVLHGGAQERAESGLTGVPTSRRFDVLGLALSMIGFTAVVYGISEAALTSWTDRNVVISLVAGGLLLASLRRQRAAGQRSGDGYAAVPQLHLHHGERTDLGRRRLPLRQSLPAADLLPERPGKLAAAIRRIRDRAGPRGRGCLGHRWAVLQPDRSPDAGCVGFALVTVGTYGLTQLDVNTSWQSLQIWLLVRGLGLGFTNIPLQTLSLSVVSNRAMARASSLTNVTRQVFGAIGITALTTIFVQQAKNYATTLVPQVKTATAAYVANQVRVATQAAVKQFTSGSPTDPSTPLGKVTATCAAPYGAAAPQHTAQIQACVQQTTQQFGQQYALTYAAQHGHQLATQFAAHYVTQFVIPVSQTHGINIAFTVSMIGCAAAIVLALFLGKDPAIEAAKRATARGEPAPEARPAVIGE